MSDTRSRGAEREFWSGEEELRARVRQQEATGRLGLAALTGTDLSGLMDEAVHAVAGVLGVEYCKVLELMPDGTTLLLRAGVGWRVGLVGTATVGTNLGPRRTPSSPWTVVVDVSVGEPLEDLDLLQGHEVVSGLTTTIRVGGRAYGVLSARARQRRSFTEDEILFLQEVAEVLGAAIERRDGDRQGEPFSSNVRPRPPPPTGASPSWPRPTRSSRPRQITGPC